MPRVNAQFLKDLCNNGITKHEKNKIKVQIFFSENKYPPFVTIMGVLRNFSRGEYCLFPGGYSVEPTKHKKGIQFKAKKGKINKNPNNHKFF